MIAHHVLFWLKANTTDDQKQAFREALETLKDIEVVKTFHIGTPVPNSQGPVDATYTFSLFVFFEDLPAAHVYDVHPLHTAFLDGFSSYFDKVIVYDAS